MEGAGGVGGGGGAGPFHGAVWGRIRWRQRRHTQRRGRSTPCAGLGGGRNWERGMPGNSLSLLQVRHKLAQARRQSCRVANVCGACSSGVQAPSQGSGMGGAQGTEGWRRGTKASPVSKCQRGRGLRCRRGGAAVWCSRGQGGGRGAGPGRASACRTAPGEGSFSGARGQWGRCSAVLCGAAMCGAATRQEASEAALVRAGTRGCSV